MTASAPIDDTTSLRRADGTLAAPLAEKLLMLSVEQGSYFEFSPVTRRIWELLESPRTLSEIVGSLTEEYDVDAETCRAEVRSVVEQLIREDLVSAG